MKKKLCPVLCAFSSLLCLCLNLEINSSPTSVFADEETIEYVTIGQFALTESVTLTEKVYIPYSYKTFVESTGRTVYTTTEPPDDNPSFPIFPPIHGDIINSITINYYYYYASPSSDKITEILTLRNDIDSLMVVLNYLDERADAFNLIGTDKTNAILGYIRSMRSSYDYGTYLGFVNTWELTAGLINTNFINFVESDETRGIKPNEYFAAFSSSSDYNYNRHSQINASYLRSQPIFLVDPICGYDLDLIHMFAVIDGRYEYTGYDPLALIFGFDSYADMIDLVSWGGDLQSACEHYASTNNDLDNAYNFSYILDDSNSKMPMSDFIADVDGVFFASHLNDGDDLIISMDAYYSNVLTMYARKNMFKGIVPDYDPNGDRGDLSFIHQTYRMMLIDYDVYSGNKTDMVDNGDYNISILGHLMDLGDESYPSFYLRNKIANMFINYFIFTN